MYPLLGKDTVIQWDYIDLNQTCRLAAVHDEDLANNIHHNCEKNENFIKEKLVWSRN